MRRAFPWILMSYSNKQMEKICLDLAEQAEPLEAGALRDVARNYSAASESERSGYELRFWHVVWILVAAYAVLTPLYFFGPQVPVNPPPTGRLVELLYGFKKEPDGRYVAQTFKFGRQPTYVNGVIEWTYNDFPIVVYENRSQLPKSDYEFQQLNPQNIWRFVTIRTSDGSDPNNNGKQYYVVLP